MIYLLWKYDLACFRFLIVSLVVSFTVLRKHSYVLCKEDPFNVTNFENIFFVILCHYRVKISPEVVTKDIKFHWKFSTKT